MSNLFAMSLSGSIVVVLMMLLRPISVKFFPAKWQYCIGQMAIVFFLIPVSLIANKLFSALPQTVASSHYYISSSVGISDAERYFPQAIEKHLSLEVMQVIMYIWIVGAIIFATWHFYCYRKFTKQFLVNSIPLSEDAAALLFSCKKAMNISSDVKLM